MFAVIAQTVDAAGFLGHYWPLVAPIVPVLVALATRYRAEKYVKRGVAVLFAAAAVVVSVLGMNWSAITLDLIVVRASVLFVLAEMTYRAAEALVQGADVSGGFNSLGVFAPNKGIGQPSRTGDGSGA